MPGPAEIHEGLARVANDGLAVAIAWHVVVAILLGAVALGGWRPSTRLVALATAAPLVSVSLAALVAGNPFNGVLLGLGAVAVAAIASRMAPGPLRLASPAVLALGGLMIGVAWLYPHFLERPVWFYAFAAPLGLVPCPSLSLVLGVGLCARGFGSRAWSVLVGLLGAFYGVFGVLRLGVWLDAPLVVGAVATLVLAVRGAPPAA